MTDGTYVPIAKAKGRPMLQWVGKRPLCEVRSFPAQLVERFAPHIDRQFAAGTRFGQLVVQGGLTAGLFNAVVAMDLPGPGSVFVHQEWDYPAPVFVGDTVTAEVEVLEARADKPITKIRCVAHRDDGTEVLRGTCIVYTMLST